jgi:hypothetical protein
MAVFGLIIGLPELVLYSQYYTFFRVKKVYGWLITNIDVMSDSKSKSANIKDNEKEEAEKDLFKNFSWPQILLSTLIGLPAAGIVMSVGSVICGVVSIFAIFIDTMLMAQVGVNAFINTFYFNYHNEFWVDLSKASTTEKVKAAVFGFPGIFIGIGVGLAITPIALLLPNSRLWGYILFPLTHIYKNILKPIRRVWEEANRMDTPDFNKVRYEANLAAIKTLGFGGKSTYKHKNDIVDLVYPEKIDALVNQAVKFNDNSEDAATIRDSYHIINEHYREAVNQIQAKAQAESTTPSLKSRLKNGFFKTLDHGYDPSPTKEAISTVLHGYTRYLQSNQSKGKGKSVSTYLNTTDLFNKMGEHYSLKSDVTSSNFDLPDDPNWAEHKIYNQVIYKKPWVR